LWVNTGVELEVTVYDLEGRVRATVSLPEEAGRPVNREEWNARIDAYVARTFDPARRPRVRRIYQAVPFDSVRPPMSAMRAGCMQHVPDVAGRAVHDDQEGALEGRVLGKVAFSEIFVALSRLAVDDGDALGLGPPLDPASEAPRHAHEPGVIEPLVRSLPAPPPHPEATGSLRELEVGSEDDLRCAPFLGLS
jgi:hypothetical protein